MSLGTKNPQLSVHSSTYSPSEVIINAEYFPGVELGDFLSLSWSGAPAGDKQYIRVDSVQQGKGARQQISVLKSVADAFGLQPWTEVQVSKVDTACASVEFVGLIFKDHFASRRDLWRFKKSVLGCSAYIGKDFTWKGMRVRVQDLRSHGQSVRSGVLTVATNFNFRSQSCRLVCLVQISKEMYDFSLGGQLHYEIFVNSFLRKLLDKWRAKQVRHSLTVIFFSRTFYLHELDPTKAKFSQRCRPIYFSRDRKGFEDMYHVVVKDVVVNTLDPDELSLQLKREMIEYPSRVGWCVPTDVFAERGQPLPKNNKERAYCVSIGVPSYASNGNFLEAINVALNNLEKHYIQRDLSLSGNSIVCISASPGVFEVDPYLAAITKQRMMDCGIGMDMISLSQPPFHVVPLFTYAGPDDEVVAGWHYEVPHWMNLSFASAPGSGSALKRVGSHERGSPYLVPVEEDMENLILIPREAEESNGTIDVLSCLPSPLAMLLSRNLPRIETTRTNSVGVECERTCGTLVFPDQKKGGLPEYSFPADFLKLQTPETENGARNIASLEHCAVRSLSPPYQRIVQHSLSPHMSTSFGGYTTLCRSLTSSWSSLHSENNLYRPVPDMDDTTGLPEQPSMPNADDSLSLSSMANSLPLGTCDTQSVMSSKRTSQFAEHDVSVYIRPRMNATQLKKNITSRTVRPAHEPKTLSDTGLSTLTQPQTMDAYGYGGSNNSTKNNTLDLLETAQDMSILSNQQYTLSVKIPSADTNVSQVGGISHWSKWKEMANGGGGGSSMELPSVPPTAAKHYQSFRAKEVEDFDDVEVGRLINPFSKEDEEKLLKLRTHNRRRWSHVFPVGEAEFKHIRGPNWKSLCEPSLLPLTTDYLPMFERENYLHSNYSLTVGKVEPLGSGNQYSNERMLMEEMVCQRLVQGFQLVEGNVTTVGLIQDESGGHSSSWRSGRGRRGALVKQQQTIAGPALDGSGSILYILSMGHRIQCLSYDSISKQIVVKCYVSRYGSNATPGNRVPYRYSIWSALENTFQTVQQEFYKYPVSEYTWNHLDELMGGWHSEEMTQAMKYRRLSLVIIPPVEADSPAGEREYVEKMHKFREYMFARVPENPGPFKFRLHYEKNDEEQQTPASSSKPEEESNECQVVHIVLSHQSDQESGEDNSSYEWLSLVCDQVVDVKRVVYMEVRWLVCISSNVEEYIQHTLYKRAKWLGLDLVPVPYLFVAKSLNLCPFTTHAYLEVPKETIRDNVIKKLVDVAESSSDGPSGGLELSFIRGSDIQCDWSGSGLDGDKPGYQNPIKGGLAESLSGEPGSNRTKHNKIVNSRRLKRSALYYHRSALAVIRVAPRGFVFSYNYLWPDIKPDEGMSKVSKLLADLKSLILSISLQS